MAWTLLITPPASAIKINLERPGDREFVRDQANLLDADSVTKIKEIADKLLTETATPILVVTIESMASCGAADMRIETFATLLFDQWGIGVAEINGQPWNTGILLLVSKSDRKARIELGGGWGRREDALCKQIMDDQIIYHFKQKNFSQGILAGVQALEAMARKEPLPTKPRPAWHYLAIIAFIGLAIFTGVSLARKGASGWAWVAWAAIFTILGYILYAILSS
ncbi:MAG: TPM domain-containing protein, partial [Planctomycetaceae bacterium]|nr:TPM domain-containing protein [Planctomycetaceae bacterium]